MRCCAPLRLFTVVSVTPFDVAVLDDAIRIVPALYDAEVAVEGRYWSTVSVVLVVAVQPSQYVVPRYSVIVAALSNAIRCAPVCPVSTENPFADTSLVDPSAL